MSIQRDNTDLLLRRLRDQIRYNTLCAPDYPEEDSTNLDREAQEILQQIAQLLRIAESDARRLMAEAAIRDTHSAFEHYARGQAISGRRLLEDLLEDLDYFQANKLPEVGFVVASDGTITPVRKTGH